MKRRWALLAGWGFGIALTACSRTYRPEYRPHTVYQYSQVTIVQHAAPTPTWSPTSTLTPTTPTVDEEPPQTSSQLVPPPVMSSRLVPPPGASNPRPQARGR